MIEPPIETAVEKHIRIHGCLDHARLVVKLGLCEAFILDWFTYDRRHILQQLTYLQH